MASNGDTAQRRERYAMIRESVMRSPAWGGLSTGAIRVYLALLVHVNADDECFPGIETLGDLAVLSRRATFAAIKELEKHGFVARIERGGGRGKSNLYRVKTVHETAPLEGGETVHETAPLSAETVRSGARNGAAKRINGAPIGIKTVHETAPEHSHEHPIDTPPTPGGSGGGVVALLKRIGIRANVAKSIVEAYAIEGEPLTADAVIRHWLDVNVSDSADDPAAVMVHRLKCLDPAPELPPDIPTLKAIYAAMRGNRPVIRAFTLDGTRTEIAGRAVAWNETGIFIDPPKVVPPDLRPDLPAERLDAVVFDAIGGGAQ